MNYLHLKVLLLSSAVLFSGCATIGNEDLMEATDTFEPTLAETSKADLIQAIGLPWDVLHEYESDTTGWLYIVLEKMVSNPMSYVPWVGFVAGGGHVTVHAKFYCFDDRQALSGRAMGREKMYKSVFSEYAAMFDDDAAKARKNRIKQELEKEGIQLDPESLNSIEWHHWLQESQQSKFREWLFAECGENGLRKIEGFEEFL